MSSNIEASIFDPRTQSFTLLMPDGVTPLQVNLSTLEETVLYNTEVAANYASQIGASIVMLFVVILVTHDSKRRSALFVMNVVSLALSAIRSLLQTLYWTGPFSEVYAYFSGDYSAVPRSAYASSIASIVMTLLFLATIELSLVMQTKVVCTTLKEIHRITLMALSVTIALLAVGFRFALTVQNAEAIMSALYADHLAWLASAALIMETVSIWYFCLVFVGKLGITLYQRRRLGLRQWGPMQIICIMGGCTMIVPSIFAILQYLPAYTFPEAGSLALTLVAICLPLSSIWAAAAIDGSSPVYHTDASQKLGSCSTGCSSRSGGASTYDRKVSVTPLSPTTMTIVEHVPADLGTILTKGNMVGDINGDFERFGVRVDRTYSVRSGINEAGK